MLPAGMLITDDLVLGFEWNLVGIFINLSISYCFSPLWRQGPCSPD